MRTMNIVLSPDPGLRQVCEPCQVGDKSLKKLAKQMLNTMYANNGCGLAAPQVGLNKRMVVIDCYDGPNETSNPLVLINPEVIETNTRNLVARYRNGNARKRKAAFLSGYLFALHLYNLRINKHKRGLLYEDHEYRSFA